MKRTTSSCTRVVTRRDKVPIRAEYVNEVSFRLMRGQRESVCVNGRLNSALWPLNSEAVLDVKLHSSYLLLQTLQAAPDLLSGAALTHPLPRSSKREKILAQRKC